MFKLFLFSQLVILNGSKVDLPTRPFEQFCRLVVRTSGVDGELVPTEIVLLAIMCNASLILRVCFVVRDAGEIRVHLLAPIILVALARLLGTIRCLLPFLGRCRLRVGWSCHGRKLHLMSTRIGDWVRTEIGRISVHRMGRGKLAAGLGGPSY